jgi:surface protein
MSYIFNNASSFNGAISAWDVSHVTDMKYVFSGASSFNRDISSWDVSHVTDRKYVFSSALSFNRDIWGTCPDSSLGVNDQNLTNVSMCPNQTDNTLFISGNESLIAVAIYNVLAKKVLTIKNTNNINVKALTSGAYTIRISEGRRQTNRKFVKN